MKTLINRMSGALAPAVAAVAARKLVLCYHRFSAAGYSDPFHNPVTTTPVDALRQQLLWLKRFAELQSLDELVSTNSQRWQVAITIDDGYRDVLDLAMPVFEELEVPVTWFIATRPVEDCDWLPWWDLAAWIRNQREGLISLKHPVAAGDWNLADAGHRSTLASALRQQALDVGAEQADRLVTDIRTAVQVPSNAFCRPDDLARAVQSPWLSLAPHTHQHACLARLDDAAQQQEISISRERLQQWNLPSSNWFAYPFGKAWARTRTTPELVRDMGFKGAFCTHTGFVAPAADRFVMPRLSVDGRWDSHSFRSRVVFSPLQARLKAQLRGSEPI